MKDPQKLLQQGMELHRAGRLDEAAARYRRVLKVQPKNADAHYLLGVIAQQQGDLAAAADRIGKSLLRNPHFAAAHSALSVVRLELGEVSGALESAERALRLTPDAPDVQYNRANALRAAGRLEEACTGYRQALALRPDYLTAANNLGVTLEQLGRLDEAKEVLLALLAAMPGFLDARNNLGKVLFLSGDLAGAEAAFDEVLRHRPDDPEANLNRGMLHLLQGRFAEGWPLYEWRAAVPGAGVQSLAGEPWRGEPLDGGVLLLYAEQGFGDTLQFIRYLPQVIERCAGRVVLLVPRPLTPLLRGLPGVERVIDEREPLPPYQRQAALPSLPGLFASDAASIPARLPYLPVPPPLRSPLAEALADRGRPRIGLVWAGNPGHHNDHNRSLPPSLLAPLLAVAEVSWVSLQKGRAEADAPPQVLPVGGLLEDFADSAALLGELDLLITVDTAVAHLAGGLGRRVWVLLPLVPDWRWLTEREDSPWYPGVMRLFRQRRFGDWAEVVERVAEALREWLVRRR
ncbi:tetratricopeptide repeat protein [Endothiovibrio diazotrophicus]